MMEAAVLNKGSPGKRILWLAVVLLILLASSPVFAATYYIAPNGNNGGAGDSSSPWKTFAFAIPKLNPGDTLMLKDGTYTKGTTGMPSVNCSAGAKNGTAAAPITLQAENERKAWLQGDGGEVLGIRNCSYWSAVGLRASNADVAGPVTSLIFVGTSNNINFRRNLITNSNRRVNQAMITYNTCKGGLVEENEIYDYLRHGFLLAHTENVTVRRNYANSRDYPTIGSIPGVTSAASGGDSLVAIYPGANNIVENNISERNSSGFSVQASGSGGYVSTNNRFYGNISLKDGSGAGLRIRTRQNNLTGMAQNTYIENQVVIGSGASGGDFRTNKNTIVTNTSIFNSKLQGFLGETPEFRGDGSPTMSIKNSLALNNGNAGFGVVNYSVFNVTSSNAFGNNPNYSPGSLAAGNMSVDPGLGSCKVFIPDNSPMKGKGAGGDDIGANVLCRYQGGKLTDQQLWNWSTGQFPCGAIVPGVNDKAGQSCFDVNKRLNVNANGCTLPATPSCKQPAPPTDLPSTGDGGGGANPCPPGGGTGGGGTDGAGQPSTAGSTFYISPSGSDSNNGTSPSTPWRTFAYALNPARASCGDTLVLLDGTYGDGTSTGKINISNVVCTAGNALTVKAQNQRKAKIVDNGSSRAVHVLKSAYIIIDGLYARSTDNRGFGSGEGEPFVVRDSNHVTIRNTLGRNPNRYGNNHVYPILNSQDVLLEDNEAYVLHRHCVMAHESERVVVRRQYCNARGGKIPDSFSKGGADLGTGDTVFSMYPCKDCILENSIADSTTTPMNLNEMNSTFGDNITMSGSKVLGSICYKCSKSNGIYPNSRKVADLNHTPQNITIRNVVFVDHSSPSAAIRASDGVNMDIGQITVIGSGGRGSGIAADDGAFGATPAQQSIVIRDSTIQGKAVGFTKASNAYNTWSGNNLNSYNNGVAFTPGLPGNWGTTTTTNPQLGGCKVWIPATSPLKGAGTGGGDIGANILYRYVNGTLTNTPLWDPVTGEFPHGAADLDGTNRVAGQSLFDIHLRLGINSPACPFPANYASGSAGSVELPPAPGMGGGGVGGGGSTACPAIKIVTEDVSCVRAGETMPLSIKLVDAVTNQPVTPSGDVYISLIPPGFTLSAGTVFQSTPIGAVYKLTPAQLKNLSITPPPGYDGTLTMSISYTPPIPGATASTTPP